MAVSTGITRISLDEKGRLLLPSKVRQDFPVETFFLTKSLDQCLWMFTPAWWEKIAAAILEGTSMFTEQGRKVQRRILAPATEVEVDKSGRITIPGPLRDHAGLNKDLMLACVGNVIEIWSEEAYMSYEEETDQDIVQLSNQLNILWPKG